MAINKKTPSTAGKTATKIPKSDSAASTKLRRVKESRYRSFKLQARIRAGMGSSLPGAFRLFRQSIAMLEKHWQIFFMIILIYGVVDFVVVRGMSAGQDYSNIKDTLYGLFGGGTAHVASGLALFLYMVGSSTQTSSASATANPYQFIWLLVVSLALIWALRQLHAGRTIRVRDSFYKGMYPLITFILVLFVVAVELVPAILGGVLYTVASSGVASTAIEQFMWATLFGLLTLLSLYMVVSSLFALYIVCLPEMTPLKALRSARQLVTGRRWTVLRKIIFLPVVLLALGAVCMVPVILIVPAFASWMFFLLGLFVLPILHSYYYALYRSLLE